MRDIQEIMNEMNVVSNEVAVAEDKLVTLQQVQQVLPNLGLACSCANACSGGVSGLTECGAASNTIPSTSCILTAPRNLVFNTTGISTLAYNLTGLNVLVVPCNCTSGGTTRTVYAVRIIGCISYTVNVPLASTNNCTANFNTTSAPSTPISGTPTVYACCCCGTAPVNNTIGFSCSLEAASIARALIAANLNCSFITPTLGVGFSSGNTVATATVGFTIQNVCTNPGGISAEL